MTKLNPDQYVHAFKAPFGIPPGAGLDQPICGAVLTPAYDFPGGPPRPRCPECEKIFAAERASTVRVAPSPLELI